MIEPISAAIEPHIKRPAPTREQVREILRSLDIEEKTMTSMVHPPLACWYGLTDPGKIMEFAAKLVGAPVTRTGKCRDCQHWGDDGFCGNPNLSNQFPMNPNSAQGDSANHGPHFTDEWTVIQGVPSSGWVVSGWQLAAPTSSAGSPSPAVPWPVSVPSPKR